MHVSMLKRVASIMESRHYGVLSGALQFGRLCCGNARHRGGRQYTYVKFKHQILLVNPMTRQIVDMFPEDQS
jgi:hypothetical protein